MFKVVCIASGLWQDIDDRSMHLGPEKDDVCTVTNILTHKGVEVYDLLEWPDRYDSSDFVRLPEQEFQQITYTKIIESEPVGVQ